ncbi:MAG: outer membrane protein assembly factor BamA [Deltaproteobacteria bacterium]|nr:outer membrane protein assembly factor BamA [Deltaproteobacteria bacterium]
MRDTRGLFIFFIILQLLILRPAFCAPESTPRGAGAINAGVLLVPFDMDASPGVEPDASNVTAWRRNVMNSLASALESQGAGIAGIDIIKGLMLQKGVSKFSEADIKGIAKDARADFAVTGAMFKTSGTLHIVWRVLIPDTGETLALYSRSFLSDTDAAGAMKESAGVMLGKMLSALKARPAQKTGVIDNIAAAGNKRVDTEAVLKKVVSKTGEPFSPDDVKDDIRNIYGTGYFDDVTADISDTASGRTLTFIVKEMPFIRKVEFRGNKELKDEKIKDSITVKENTVLDRVLLGATADKIKALYADEGYYLAAVKPVVKTDGVEAAVTFEINEGPEVRVKRITVIGADLISEDKIKGVMRTDEAGFFTSLSGSGKFNEHVFQNDLTLIMGKYFDSGYINADILDHRVLLSEDKRWFYITIALSEGGQFSVGKIDVQGDMLPDTGREELAGKIKLSSGDTFNRSKLSHGLDALADVYGDKGYAYADIKPVTRIDAERKIVDITVEIKKNELVYIERIDISGNTKTQDKVIRREFELAEGDLFSSSGLKRSKNGLKRLGYFEDVNIAQTQGSAPDKAKLDVGVKERPTGAVSLGAGYSSVDKIVGTASISQSNFMGTGVKLELSGTVSSKSSRYNLGIYEPWLFDKPISTGFDLYNTDRDYPDFKIRKNGGDIKVGFPVSGRDTRGYMTYRLEDIHIRDVAANASPLLKKQAGKSTLSSVEGTLKRDSRDDAFFPNEGSVAVLSAEYAGGVIGGSRSFVKYSLDGVKYVPFFWETTFSLRAGAGFVQGHSGKDVPVDERFYLGGINTLRGFRTRSIGPKDPATGEIIGGNTMALMSAEFIFPLLPEQAIKGVIFYDAGNAYQGRIDLGDLRHGAGVGLRWFSPLGPLRFEFGMNLDRRPGEKAHQWDFTIGANF